MSDTNERSVASAGSVAGEPVAWFVDGVGYPYATVIRERAQAWADSDGGVIVPLYRQPQPTLTDAEREAIKEASEFYIGTRTGLALGGLLERLKGER